MSQLNSLVPVIAAKIKFAVPQHSMADLRYLKTQIERHYGPVLQWRDFLSEATHRHMKGTSMAMIQVPLEDGASEEVKQQELQRVSKELERVVGILKPKDQGRVGTLEWRERAEKNIRIHTRDREGNEINSGIEVELPNHADPFYKVSKDGLQWSVRVSHKVSIPMIITTSEFGPHLTK